MATADDLLTELYRRTRDPDRVATPEALALDLLGRAQQACNLFTRSTIETADFTLKESRLLYSISIELPACARLEGVRIGTKDLTEVPWTSIKQIDHHWFRTTGPLAHWAKVGRDLWAIYPGPEADTGVTMVYTKMLDPFADTTEDITIRSEFFPLLLDLTEALMLIYLRRMGNAQNAVEPFEAVFARLQAMVVVK